MLSVNTQAIVTHLNRDCECATLRRDDLHAALKQDAASADLISRLLQERPHLFASTSVFLPMQTAMRIQQAVTAIEAAADLPAWRMQTWSAPSRAVLDSQSPSGVFMGYDFHINAGMPRLIEINTNAGGALLNAAAARAHQLCCGELLQAEQGSEQAFVAMFESEWQAQRGAARLGRIAIVDDAPETQYLYPEFLLFKNLFESAGYASLIVDAAELEHRDGRLWHGDAVIDLVYNRLTDFSLQEPRHAALHSAWANGEVVLTPHPGVHARLADKRHLITLSDTNTLRHWGLDEPLLRTLAAVVPKTVALTAENVEALWAQRAEHFFKPFAGYAGKAAYRGDKLTRKVWEGIREAGFVAQSLVPPATRRINADTALKFDVRAYTYRGQVQSLAARLYAGQTTNFRTEGGGFAPVVVLPQTADFIAAGDDAMGIAANALHLRTVDA